MDKGIKEEPIIIWSYKTIISRMRATHCAHCKGALNEWNGSRALDMWMREEDDSITYYHQECGRRIRSTRGE